MGHTDEELDRLIDDWRCRADDLFNQWDAAYKNVMRLSGDLDAEMEKCDHAYVQYVNSLDKLSDLREERDSRASD